MLQIKIGVRSHHNYPIKAKYFVGIYGALELFNGLGNLNTGVAHFAHVGGLVAGFILIKAWKIRRPNYY